GGFGPAENTTSLSLRAVKSTPKVLRSDGRGARWSHSNLLQVLDMVSLRKDKLLILWSPAYLDRLWCVYELAVFLRTHDKEDVIVVNLDHLKLCVTLMLTQFMSILIVSLDRQQVF
ncbi:hypothetical protein FOZ62_003823, partial [Perkinsus olseni]